MFDEQVCYHVATKEERGNSVIIIGQKAAG